MEVGWEKGKWEGKLEKGGPRNSLLFKFAYVICLVSELYVVRI